jgi:hypothetical protein
MMADLPILFSGPMVRALLREIEQPGTGKTQTRRVLSNSKPNSLFNGQWADSYVLDPGNASWREQELRYAVGDRLYVREAWRCNGWATDVATIFYRASEGDGYTAMCEQYPVAGKTPQRVTATWRPGIHMPRWASRITLTVTDVRAQRLQEISKEDAIAEGIEDVTSEVSSGDKSLRFWKRYRDGGWNGYIDNPIASYASLWTEINGPGSWEANPWVAAYTFRPVLGNIDEVPACP